MAGAAGATFASLIHAVFGAAVLQAHPAVLQAHPFVSTRPEFRFVEVGAKRGIGAYVPAEGMGSGIAAADFDGDGDVDVFVPQGAGHPDLLYQNRGDGHFDEVGAVLGVADSRANRVALWLDYDSDADLDLLVGNDRLDADTAFTLYRQTADGFFEDVSVSSGIHKPPTVLFETHYLGGLCAGDVTGDGLVDVFAAQWYGPSHLFRNNGDGTFTDISRSTGIAQRLIHGHQPVMADFNRDGMLDIYVAVDFGPNVLWVNQGDETFVDMAPAFGVDNSMNDMGVALGDYDNDGDFDIYVTNIDWVEDGIWKHNVLLRNDSGVRAIRFVELAESTGVAHGYWGWGATFLDGDRDGDLDLATTNGWFMDWPEPALEWTQDPSQFFRNQGPPAFEYRPLGDDVGFNDRRWGSGLVTADFDRDGDLDLMQSCMDGQLRLLDNQAAVGRAAAHRFLVVQPRMRSANTSAIGAIVRVAVGQSRMSRLITAGCSYLCQEPAEAFFGFPNARRVDWLAIEWPDGRTTRMENVATGKVYRIWPDDAGPGRRRPRGK